MDTIDNNALTATDLKALRTANTCICFDHACSNEWGVGQGKIRCFRSVEPKKNDPYPQDDLQYKIGVYSKVTDYGGCRDRTKLTAYAHIPTYRETLQTVLHFLRAGDTLTLGWIRDNHSDYTREAGIHHDQFYLNVSRGKKNYSFLLDVSITPNNSARMVRDF